MKNLLIKTLMGSGILFCLNPLYADQYDSWGLINENNKMVTLREYNHETGAPGYYSHIHDIYKFNSATYEKLFISSFQPCETLNEYETNGGCGSFDGITNASFDQSNGKIEFPYSNSKAWTYDIKNDSWSRTNYTTPPANPFTQSFKTENIIKKDNGEIHIGPNSWITKEENGRQKVWAKDAAGNSIPIDYTNGTKLLINGRDVEQSINNVGALSAALTGLPAVPTDTTLACGLGTGTHGGDFAFSGGCASKINDKLSINYAASMTMPGQDYAGDFEDTFSARAGFVWKLGKSNKPTQISMQAKEQMEDKINSLEEKNEKILSKNQKLENKVSTLLARLERLEKVALSESKSKNLATIKLP